MTLTVEVLNKNALNLLSDLENLELIKLNSPIKSTAISREKLSSQFAGALKLTNAQYEVYREKSPKTA